MTKPFLEFDGTTLDVHNLSAFGFEVNLPETADDVHSGTLLLGDHRQDVRFRVRTKIGDVSACSLVDASLDTTEALSRFVADQERGFVVTSSLEGKSYDELAKGEHDKESEVEKPVSGSGKKKGNAGLKTVVLLVMMITVAVLLGGTFFFLRSRSLLSVNNSALSGNLVSVNAPMNAEITEFLVSEGQLVQSGEELVRLHSTDMEADQEELAAKLDSARVTVQALKKQQAVYKTNLDATTRRLELEVGLAKAELVTAKDQLAATNATISRLQPYMQTGAVTMTEMDIAKKQSMVAKSAVDAAQNKLNLREFALNAAVTDKVIFVGDRVDTEPDRLAAEIEIAEAEVQALKVACEVAKSKMDGLVIRAPRGGKVYVTYREAGQFVRAADQVAALSVDDNVWAAGHVSPQQAKRIRPGQRVAIKVPASGDKFYGVVSAVGHRSLYSKGGYTADFRGAVATDVPIKVTIPELPDAIPAGIRLEMSVETGFGVAWIDRMLGFEHELAWSDNPHTKQKAAEQPTASLSESTPPTNLATAN